VLDTRLAPVGPAVATPSPLPAAPEEPLPARRFASVPRSLSLLLPLAICLGASPFFSGFYDSRIWVPAGLALVVLVTGGVIAAPLRLSRAGVLALAGLAGFAAWALSSTLWAESVEQAVVDGNRLIVLAALLAAVLLLVRSDTSALWLVGTLAAAVVAVGAISLVQMLGSDASSLFLAGRLDGPLGYINGQASFYLLALWPCIALAEQRRWPALSGAGMAAAILLGSLLVLSQSRGVAVAAIASAIIVLGLVPGRLRRVWTLVVVGGSLAIAMPRLIDVYEQGRTSSVPADVASAAAVAALLSAAVGGLVWGLLTWSAQRSDGIARGARPVSAGLLAIGVAALAAVALASLGDITRTVDKQYTAFVRLGVEPQGSASLAAPSSRLASGAGTRYDYWRIAWSSFRDHPVAGVGAGNYDVDYFAHRATVEDVRQPHSIALQSLSELGVVGAALLGLFLAGLGLGAVQLARAARTSASARFLSVAGAGAVVAWIAHTSVDWIHLLPGVSGVALALGAVLVVHRPDASDKLPVIGSGAGLRRLRPRLATALIVAIGLATAGVSLSRQGLAEHFRVTAQRSLAERPADALRDADRSLRLDTAAVETYYVKAAALARFDEGPAARETLLAAARREPHDFVTWALLGDLAVRGGDLGQARRDYGRASELNPRDAGLREAALHPARAAGSG
jgi:O-antigen ligase